MIGRSLGPYRVVDKLGAGGMGDVYRARDTRLGRDVALKTLSPQLVADPQALARFDRESRTIAALSHPNILAVYDVGTEAGIPFVVFELLVGETLRSRLLAGLLSREDAVAYARQIARGLAAAHDKGVVHRDIKPENIFITGDGTVKILDFGLARERAIDDGETRLGGTTPGMVLGTAAYMSPEQARGQDVDARSDVFSWGAVLYEMLTGRRAFPGSTSADSFAAVIRDEPPALTTVDPTIPDALARVVTRCLSKDAGGRFASGRQLLEAFEALSGASGSSGRQAAPGAGTGRRSIAVLPFDDISADRDNEFFVDGLTDEVISDLSKLSGLRVISRTSARQFKRRDRDLATVRRELDVQYVLEGSVRKAGQKIRVTVQLVDAEADTPLWSEKYNGTLDDIFDIQERVARAIAAELRVKLTPEESREIAAHGISDPRAYELYLRARGELLRFTPDGLGRALMDIDEARARVGENVQLLGLQGDVLWQQINLGVATDPGQIRRVEAIGRRIDALEPGSSEADRLLACVAVVEGRYEEAWRRLGRAAPEAPADSFTTLLFVGMSALVGKPDAARPIAARVIDLDPLQAVGYYIAGWLSYMCDEDLANSLPLLQRGYELGPFHSGGVGLYAPALVAVGRIDEARTAVERLRQASPDENLTWICEAFIWGLDGQVDRIVATLTPQRRAWAWTDLQFALQLAECFALAGDCDRAFEWLERAVDRGAVNYPFLSIRDPFLATLRGDPRFTALMAKVEEAWRRL